MQRATLALSGFAAGAAAGTGLLPCILGALGGAAAGWLLSLRALGVRLPSALLFARLSLLLLGIGRLGCFLAGCCFGTPTDLPWGVQYGTGSAAHLLHWHLGLVDEASAALPVHPVQLCEGALALLAGAALPVLRRKVRSDASLALGAAAWYAAVRAALDPFRGMVNTFSSAVPFGAMSAFQWGALAAAIVLAAAAFLAARWKRDAAIAVPPVAPLRPAALFVAQAAVALVAQAAVTPFLALLVAAALAATGGVLTVAALRKAAPARRRTALALAAGALLVVPVGLGAAENQEPGGRG